SATSKKPGEQYPHCAAPRSANVCCNGCNSAPSAIPSIVFTSRPSASRPSIRQESIERPSTSTAQVPHSPSSQPCLVPVRFRSSRRTSSSVLCGAKATSVCSPLSVKRICFLLWRCTVFLLHFIQNRIIDQPRLADICCERDERRSIVEPVNFLQRLCIRNRNVVQPRARLGLHGRANQVDETTRISLTIFVRILR